MRTRAYVGVFRQAIEVGPLDQGQFEPLEAIVDTAASFTTISEAVLRRLGVTPYERRAFTIADGSTIERDVGYAWVRTEGRAGISPVVFGDAGGPNLLGAFTLEVLQLGVDAGHQRLVPVPAYLLIAHRSTH